MGSRLTPHAIDSSDVAAGVPAERIWFAENVFPHEGALRAWLRVRFPSLSESDDIVQESYFRLIRVRARGRVENAKSYLFMIARNVAFDLFRRHRSAPMIPASDSERASVIEDRNGVAESVCASQEFEILLQAIDSLPERCRQIMQLQKLQG
jgi:RNA polymerase sigma factor (sigma-70 family)